MSFFNFIGYLSLAVLFAAGFHCGHKYRTYTEMFQAFRTWVKSLVD